MAVRPSMPLRSHPVLRTALICTAGAAVLAAVLVLTGVISESDVKRILGIGCDPQTKASPGWRTEADIPRKRVDEPKAVAIGDSVYLGGGIGALQSFGHRSRTPGVNERTEVKPLDDFLRYDVRTRRWQELPRLPAPRNHFGMALHDGNVLVVGGEGTILNGEYPSPLVFSYSPQTNRWTRQPSMPFGVTAGAVGVIGDRLYVAGGLYHGRPQRRLQIYDFKTRRWTRGPDMPSARQHIAGGSVGGRFYVIGGRDERTDALRTVESFDPATNRWSQAGTWKLLDRMRTPRHGFGAAVANDRIYAFGGSPCARFAATNLGESYRVPPA
jgi:N-acetylneuraminic acid mutarotase